MLEAAVSGLDLHETKISYTSNSELQKLNKHSCRDCVWIAHFFFFFPPASLLRIAHIALLTVMVFQTWKSTHLSYSMFPWATVLVSRNTTQSCTNQLRDLKTCMKKHCLPIWRHLPKKYCITKKHSHWLKQNKQKTSFQRCIFVSCLCTFTCQKNISLFTLSTTQHSKLKRQSSIK